MNKQQNKLLSDYVIFAVCWLLSASTLLAMLQVCRDLTCLKNLCLLI